MNNSIKINDHFYDLVPRPTKQELQILNESIMKNGQREPIVVSKNYFILDGHSRFEICQNLGIDPIYRVMKFDTYQQEESYVIESNMERRQVSNFQKLEIYYEYYEKIKKQVQSQKNRDSHGRIISMDKNVRGTRSIEILADKLKMSVNQVQCGLWIINNASENHKIRLRNGSTTINKTYDTLKRSQYNISFKKSLTLNNLYEHFENDIEIIDYLNNLITRFKKEKSETQKNKDLY